jgi:hypothetical protein
MRLSRLAAGCATIAVAASCSLSLEGSGPEDVGIEAGAVDGWVAPPDGGSHPGNGPGASAESGVVGAAFDAQLASDAPPAQDATFAPESGAGLPTSGPSPTLDGGAPSLCGNAGLLFCDGFENGSIAWGPVESGGTIAVDDSRAFRGRHSAHAQIGAVSGNDQPTVRAAFQHTFLVPLPSPLFVRMFVYLPAPVPPSVGAFLDVVQGLAPFSGVQLNFRPPTGYLGGTAYNGPNDDWSSQGDVLPTDSWQCVEMELEGTSDKVVSHVFLGGNELPEMKRSIDGNVPPLNILAVGLSFFQANAQPQTDLWIDEVAADKNRIGCTH